MVWTKDKVDRTRSTIGSESAEADKFRSKGALTTMLILALLINYILEGFIPAFRFSGFELSFFIGTIVYGDWVGIYNLFHFNIFFLLVAFAVFNLRNGKPHILRVWLGLILIAYLLSSIPILNTYMGIRNFIELIMLIISAIYLSFSETTKEDFISTIVVMWAFYNIFFFGITSTIGGLTHFIFIILFFIIFCMGNHFAEDRTQIKWWLIILILFDFFLPQILKAAYPTIPVDSLPWLTFGMVIFGNVYKPYWFPRFLLIALVAFYFLQYAFAGNDTFAQIIGQRGADQENIAERMKFLNPKEWLNRITQWTNQSVYYASGQNYYAGRVDENAKKDLGVFIEGMDRNDKIFYDNERIIIDANLKAQNFVSEEDVGFESLTIQLDCWAQQNGKNFAHGKIYPKNKYEIDAFDTESIQCIFDPWQLQLGSYDIIIEATFNFQTQTYLKRYFVNTLLLDSLKSKKVIEKDSDILKLNKISDTMPSAKNSAGPVEIRVSDQVPSIIELSNEIDTKQIFGVQIANRWRGEIKRIKGFEFYLPDGIYLDEGYCTFAMGIDAISDSRFEGYIKYSLQEKNNIRLRNIKKEIVQRCSLAMKKGDIEKVLGPEDVTTRYIQLKTDYDYLMKESVGITVAEPPGVNMKIFSPDRGAIDSGSMPLCKITYDKKESFILWLLGAAGVGLKNTVVFELYAGDSLVEPMVQEQCTEARCEHFYEKTFPKGTKLRCKATVDTSRFDEPAEWQEPEAYVIVKNSAPVVKSVDYLRDANYGLTTREYVKGDIAICSASVEDRDNDEIIAEFSFEGFDVAPTTKECRGNCFVEIPTGSAQKATAMTCKVRVFDGEDYSKEVSTNANLVMLGASP
ncbi:hypothetical protein J4401_00240 [Candidatus Woesearchaeota archaeon]|nr:hypothetical protein [Candidatus Woesearchaeota archaeon]